MGWDFNPFKIAEDIAQGASEAAEAAANAAGEAIDHLGEFADDATGFAEHAAEEAGKAAESAAGAIAENAPKAAETVASAVTAGGAAIAEAATNALKEKDLREYRPVFSDQYFSAEFNRPKVVIISEEGNRKNVEVCKGAIGWLAGADTEVLHLYETALETSGLTFYPHAICDTAYLGDPFDNDRYIDIANYVETNKMSQFTELKYIARTLGASECQLQCYESKTESSGASHSHGLSAIFPIPNANANVNTDVLSESSLENSSVQSSQVQFMERFETCSEPQKPTLKWFASNEEILGLIDARCDHPGSAMTEYSFDISSTSSYAMSLSFAQKLDAALEAEGIKLALKGGDSLSASYKREVNKRLVYSIKF